MQLKINPQIFIFSHLFYYLSFQLLNLVFYALQLLDCKDHMFQRLLLCRFFS
jgi:hypothetical protein